MMQELNLILAIYKNLWKKIIEASVFAVLDYQQFCLLHAKEIAILITIVVSCIVALARSSLNLTIGLFINSIFLIEDDKSIE
jgi:uncharacterized membrane protein (UPF0182 family)